ncbi:MAG TPA: hypothetical protein VIA45_11630 [Thermoanaerobaculia bacterium]
METEAAGVRSGVRIRSPAIPSNALRSVGRLFYALPLVGFGLLHIALGDFATRFAPGWPAWIPGRPLAAHVLGLALVAAGLAIAFEMRTRPAALTVAGIILWFFVVCRIPAVMARPGFGGSWTNPAKYLALLGGALLIASRMEGGDGDGRSAKLPAGEETSPPSPIETSVLGARFLLSAFFVIGGIQHFVYEDFVVTLIPAYIPAHVFWSRFAGAALIAAGLGLWNPKTARPAAMLSGLMIFLWFLMLHIPRAAGSSQDPMEWSGVFESLAISGVALTVAGCTPRRASGPARR